jgi:ribosomal protein S18 acetylase RimI-like enzyme
MEYVIDIYTDEDEENIMIKKLDLNDRETLKSILSLQFASYRIEADLIGFDEIPPLKDTEETLGASGETFYGYFVEETLAGIISYKVEDSVLDIHRVAVHPSFFKRGIAKKLLAHIEKENIWVDKIIVSTGTENKPAVELYLNNGFKKVRDIEVAKNFFITCFEKGVN